MEKSFLIKNPLKICDLPPTKKKLFKGKRSSSQFFKKKITELFRTQSDPPLQVILHAKMEMLDLQRYY